MVKGDGDGTVNSRSLNACNYWTGQAAQNNKTVYRYEIANAEHYDILSDHRAINHILNELNLPNDYPESLRKKLMKIRLF